MELISKLRQAISLLRPHRSRCWQVRDDESGLVGEDDDANRKKKGS
jgi:hypothetical protein